MKRFNLFFLIFFITFVTGTALGKIYFVLILQFLEKSVGSFGICGDGIGSFSVMESYDGQRLTLSKARFFSQ